jgi:hypothetical protein
MMQRSRSVPGAIPARHKRAKTGSNVRDGALAEHYSQRFAAQNRALERHARAYRRQCTKLFSKADRRVAVEIVNRTRREEHRSTLNLGPESGKRDRAKAIAQTRLARELSRALPGYRAWRKLARVHRRDQQRLAKLDFGAVAESQVHVDFADVSPPTSHDTQTFVPPFSVYDVFGEDWGLSIVQDQSFVDPSTGYLVTNVDFRHEDDGPFVADLLGLGWTTRYSSAAACGINFTTSRAGRLRIGAGLRNLYNRLTFSIQDRFGFSEAQLEIDVRLFVAVVQPNRVITLTKTILTDGYTSYGSERSGQWPEFDTSSLHLVGATTNETFPANSGVQILAGSEVLILSEINDMRTSVHALLEWQLEQLTLEVV